MIRPLRINDLPAYANLRQQAIKTYPMSFGAEPDAPFQYERAKKTLAVFDPENFVLGFFHEGHLAGMAGFVREQNSKKRHKGFVWGMYVDPGHHGMGIGKKLLQTLLEHISGIDGLEKVNLSVTDQSPAAIRLYQQLGFTEYGREANAMHWQGISITEIYMDKTLMF